MSAPQLAAYLEVPITTLYAWRTRRKGPPAIKVGKHLRYRAADVAAWLDSELEKSSHETRTPGLTGHEGARDDDGAEAA